MNNSAFLLLPWQKNCLFLFIKSLFNYKLFSIISSDFVIENDYHSFVIISIGGQLYYIWHSDFCTKRICVVLSLLILIVCYFTYINLR